MAATIIKLTSTDVENLCQLYFKEDTKEPVNFQIKTFKLQPVSEDPSGFFGHHRFLCVEVAKLAFDGKETVEKLRFFTKSAPEEIASRMEYLEQFGVFKKEISVYRDVLPKLEKYFADITPKCYYADNNLLVFEDLNQYQFKMAASRNGLLDYEHMKCTIKTLAALHAASIVYEVRENQKINKLYPEAVVENAYPLNYPADHMRYQNFRNALKVFHEFIKLMPKYENNLEYIFANLKSKMAVVYPMAQTSTKYHNVFSHGDMWANNVMFQYGRDTNTIPTQSRFVDFQLARYAPPMLDLITILTIPTSRDFRQKYIMELLADYYTYLTVFLKHQHLSLDDFMTEDQFYASFKEFRIFGLIESCFFSHLTILPPELTLSLTSSTDGFTDFFERKRVEICLKAFTTDAIYRERLSDMLEDLIDNYVLGQENK